MANAWYEHGLREFARGNIDWVNDDIRVALVDTADYTVDLVNHQDRADIPAAGQVALSSASLATKTVTGAGILDAADITLSSVTGDASEALVIYKHTGVEANDTLLMYIDTATGLPTPTLTADDVVIAWPNTGDRIGAL